MVYYPSYDTVIYTEGLDSLSIRKMDSTGKITMFVKDNVSKERQYFDRLLRKDEVDQYLFALKEPCKLTIYRYIDTSPLTYLTIEFSETIADYISLGEDTLLIVGKYGKIDCMKFAGRATTILDTYIIEDLLPGQELSTCDFNEKLGYLVIASKQNTSQGHCASDLYLFSISHSSSFNSSSFGISFECCSSFPPQLRTPSTFAASLTISESPPTVHILSHAGISCYTSFSLPSLAPISIFSGYHTRSVLRAEKCGNVLASVDGNGLVNLLRI